MITKIFTSKIMNNLNWIFLIDAIGALLTAFFLFGVLATFEVYFGMPSKVLYLLAGIACCFSIYSISCYLLIKENWKPFLIVIIISNTIYALLSIGFIIAHSDKLTKIGFLYFSLEIIIIGLIVIMECKWFVNIKRIKKN